MLSAERFLYLLWSLSWRLAGVQRVAGVLEDFSGASLVLLPTQAVDKEQLGGGLSQRRFGLFG